MDKYFWIVALLVVVCAMDAAAIISAYQHRHQVIARPWPLPQFDAEGATSDRALGLTIRPMLLARACQRLADQSMRISILK